MWNRIMLTLLLVAITAGGSVAQMPNITYLTDPSWQYPVLPTSSIPATFPITVPATLPGNSNTIYWNMAGINDGTGPTVVPLMCLFLVDSQFFGSFSDFYSLGAGVSTGAWDVGPATVRGGRHTIEGVYDSNETIAESDETDNWWAHQFVFTPYDLIDSLPVSRGTPPNPVGGFSSIIDGSPIGANCDGFRFSSTGWWNVVTIYATDTADDYDINLFNASTGSENGFISSLTGSYATAGLLDGVIVNRNMTGFQVYDAGVTNFSGMSDFVIEHVTSGTTWIGANMTVHFDNDEYLKIWDINFPDPGWFTVAVTDSLNTGLGYQVALIDQAMTVGALSVLPGKAFTDDNGEIRLHEQIITPGYFGLVLFRNPTEGGMAMDLTLRVEHRAPDLKPGQVPLWHSPVVPTPVPMTGPLNPTLPDTLHGYTTETYLNYGLENVSTVTSDAVTVAVYQDGDFATFHGFLTSGFGANEVRGDVFSSPFEYPGGRHTLIVEADYTESIHETYETNNIYGEQYCWSPLELRPGLQYGHGPPGYYIGGMEFMDAGELFFFNCDGYRMPTGYNEWEGLVLTPGPNSDYDLSVHYPLVGVKDGFDDFLSASIQLTGEIDYVLFNNNVLAPMIHDFGVENFGGDEPYTVEAVGSTNLPVPIGGHYGPYTLPISNMLHLYNIYLSQDIHAFRLENLGAPVDWSFALHRHDEARPTRTHVVPSGESNRSGPGGHEWFTVDIQTAGWYGLAVCKNRPMDYDLEGEYRLTILQGVSDVADDSDLPTATMLSGVHPNPFNPQTTVSFDLAASCSVTLDIYDVKGALVRRLVNEPMLAGHHTAVWDGRDDEGARAASGVYLAKFSAGGTRETQKVVMVK